jgi:hypothetical protein
MPYVPPADPLKPAVGATNLRKGTVVGFDDPVYASAPAPGPLGAAAATAADASACLHAGLDAFLALDGDAPDFAAAGASVAEAKAALADALAEAAGLPDARTKAKATALLRGAGKALGKADDSIAAGRADAAIARLTKGGRKLVAALLLVSPQPAVSARAR